MSFNLELKLALVAIQKCLNLLLDDLDPNPKKLWLINQSRKFKTKLMKKDFINCHHLFNFNDLTITAKFLTLYLINRFLRPDTFYLKFIFTYFHLCFDAYFLAPQG